MDRAAARDVARERAGDLGDQGLDLLAHARALGRAAAFHGQEGLGHGDADLRRVETRDLAVAPDHLDGAGRRRRHFRRLGGLGNVGQSQGLGNGGCGLHVSEISPEPNPIVTSDISINSAVGQGDCRSMPTTIYWGREPRQTPTGSV